MTNDRIIESNGGAFEVTVALAGNPNCGKTTIFNALTGERQAVGNYSGVTVEKVEGRLIKGPVSYRFVDLPGTYSLTTFSRDEVVARDFLLHSGPDVVVNVVDASNLERNLFLTLQLKELGLPVVVVLNMCDLAKARGIIYDVEKLKNALKTPVVEVIGVNGKGFENLLATISEMKREASDGLKPKLDLLKYSDSVESEISRIDSAIDSYALSSCSDNVGQADVLGVNWIVNGSDPENVTSEREPDAWAYRKAREHSDVQARRRWVAIKLLENDKSVQENWKDSSIETIVSDSIGRLAENTTPMTARFAAERYAVVRNICRNAVRNGRRDRVLLSDQADRLLTHPFWGLGIFFVTMYLVFWATFALGNVPVSWLEAMFNWLGDYCNNTIWESHPDSLLRSMVVDGVIGGVGGVLTFFPNIFILFAAISALEESGYMARGAFLTDRFLSRFGLTGKSFIPMLVGFGCSVPAVMSTRIIEDKKSRLSTIFVVPLMSCGARFPIYVLLIPAFFDEKWQAPILWSIYFAGIVIAAIISKILSTTKFRKEHNPLLIELPAYHAPTIRTVGRRALERGWMYLHKAGTSILGVSLALWFLSTFPRLPESETGVYEQKNAECIAKAEELGFDLFDANFANSIAVSDDLALLKNEEELQDYPITMNPDAVAIWKKWQDNNNARSEAEVEYSMVGRLGKALEPIIQYAGFDWRIGTALVGAFAAKEVFVAQLGIVFKVGVVDENSKTLRQSFAENYSPLVGICVIIFCLVGAPCMATFVVVAKEASYKWAIAQWLTLTTTAFALAVIVYQVGLVLHWGA